MADLDLEMILSEAKEVMESCIRRIRAKKVREWGAHVELLAAIDEEIGDFDGYWRCIYSMVGEKFGNEAAKEFQKEIIIHHYNLTEGGGDAGALQFCIGDDMALDEYEKIIKNYLNKKIPIHIKINLNKTKDL